MLNNDHESFAAAQARAAAAVSCESVVLPSGLTVLCRTMPGYSSVHAIYATGFGSVHRAFRLDGKQVTLPAGTAHFLEHKMCETPKGDSFTFYAKTGASANAFTSYDRTCYLFSATQKIDENLDILLGMVGKPWFTKATIAKEQGIIGQEIKMYDDSPDWRLLNALFRCLYADHPLRDDIAGTVESIAELTPQMLYSCTRGFYAPSNMVLSVAGKITLAQAVDACKRNGLYRARAPHEVEWDIPAQTGPLPHKEAFFTMPVTKPCFGVAYREEPLAEGDLKRELLLDMLGDLVVGGLTKLYRRLYDEALVNPEFSGDFIAVRGACTVAFTGESDTPRQVVDLLQEEIERMRREGVDPEVFMLVKNQMYGELLGDVVGQQTMHGKMVQRAVRSQRCLCTGEKLDVVLVHNGHDGRPGARDVNGLRTQVLRQLKDVVAALDQRQAVLLVQHVLGRHTQQRVVALAEGRRGQRRAGQVVDGILMADHGGQRRACLAGQQAEVRHKRRKRQLGVNVLLDAVDLALVDDAGHKAAQHGGGDVVGMALDGRRQRQHLALGQLVAQQGVRAHDARHNACRAGPEAARHRDVVALGDAQPLQRDTQLVIDDPGRAVDQVVAARRDVGPIDGRNLNAVRFLKRKDVVHRNGQTQRVKPGADVGAGGRDGYSYHIPSPPLSLPASSWPARPCRPALRFSP